MVDTFVLGPHRYAVAFVEKLSKKKRVGEANLVTNTVSLRNDQSASQLRSTMLHEALHHACWNGSARFAEGWTDELEEAFICAVEGAVLELFVRSENEPLRRWIQAQPG